MAHMKRKLLRLAVHARRHPYVFALIGFVAGVASFLLVDRQEEMAGMIALFVLASWLWLMLETPIRSLLKRLLGWDLPPTLVRFTTQVVHQESFFFVLPFLLITTTWASGQAVFTGVICLAALISVVDPFYFGWLAKKRWLYLGYHTLALFVVLLTSLPLIFQLTTPQSYAIATSLAMLLAFPSLARVITVGGAARAAGLMGLTLTLAATAWFGRLAVPPATLWLTEGQITRTVDRTNRSPGNGLTEISVDRLNSQGIFAYTAIRAPRGLNERVYHQWIHEGQAYDKIALDISGGREAGYRAWTRKNSFPADPKGRWRVQVTTEAGQMIGTIRFRVTD